MDYLNTHFVIHVFVINGMEKRRISIHILSLVGKKDKTNEANEKRINIQKLANKCI